MYKIIVFCHRHNTKTTLHTQIEEVKSTNGNSVINISSGDANLDGLTDKVLERKQKK